eukprot:TRINITY_DN66423_c4_g14_i1.p1 TRINITY_DN66423_c4_g14~~TRINITY_DN66423_c4_g14_i1.p1  ORF type:complete len:752 (+),score=395.15 TRINITY_DN66423_c4_g14_i1:307-2256(+)
MPVDLIEDHVEQTRVQKENFLADEERRFFEDDGLADDSPVSLTLFHRVNVTWRMFGGLDWAQRVRKDPSSSSSSVVPSGGHDDTDDGDDDEKEAQDDAAVDAADGAAVGGLSTLAQMNYFDHDDRDDDDDERKIKLSEDERVVTAQEAQEEPTAASVVASAHPEGSGRQGRQTDRVMDVTFRNATLRLESYKEGTELASLFELDVEDVEMLDHLNSSMFRKFLCLYRDPTLPGGGLVREIDRQMFHMCWQSVRPDPVKQPLREESRLRWDIMPLRLNVDQDTLEFLIEFFSYSPPSTKSDEQEEQEEEEAPPTYFQYFELGAFPICIDYMPKRVDYRGLRDGDYVQLVHMFPLEAMRIDLCPVKLTGVPGWGHLFADMAQVWADEIAKKQAYRYLAGMTPVRSLVNVGSGVADLVLVPIAQYKRDGRLLRGMLRGMSTFARKIALEALHISAQIAMGAQTVLEAVDSVVGASPKHDSREARRLRKQQRRLRLRREAELRRTRARSHRKLNRTGADDATSAARVYHRMADQPDDYHHGLRQAYESLSRAMHSVANAVVVVPKREYEQAGARATVRSVLRAVPGAVLTPMIGATQALSRTLLGARNALSPRTRMELRDKYKKKKSVAESAASGPAYPAEFHSSSKSSSKTT